MEDVDSDTAKSNQTYRRTTQQQLGAYLNFIEANPDLLARKKTLKNPQLVQNKWKQLSIKLNALNGPTRTPLEWKNSLTHWKNKLKSRARKKKIYSNGGTPSQKNKTDKTSWKEKILIWDNIHSESNQNSSELFKTSIEDNANIIETDVESAEPTQNEVFTEVNNSLCDPLGVQVGESEETYNCDIKTDFSFMVSSPTPAPASPLKKKQTKWSKLAESKLNLVEERRAREREKHLLEMLHMKEHHALRLKIMQEEAALKMKILEKQLKTAQK